MSSAATRRTGRVEMLEQLVADPRRQLGAEAARQLILVRDDHAVGLLHRGGDRVPVERHDRAQVDDHHADAVLLGLLRREQRALHERAPRQHDDVGAFAADGGLAERDHVVAARVLALVVGLAVEVLVLEDRAPGRRSGSRCAAVRPRPARSTGTRCGCRGSARRCSRPTASGTARRRAGSRRSSSGSPSGTRTRCSSGSASSTSRRASASSPARCSRRTGSRRPA